MKKLYALLFATFTSFAFSQSGLIAKYDFSGTANDLSGNGHNGTVMGSASLTTDRHGNTNSAYFFSGSGDYIDLGVMSLNSIPLTISMWCKRPSIDNAAHCLLGQSMNQIPNNSLNIMLTELINPPYQSVGFDLYADGVYDTTGAASLAWENWCFTFDGTTSATIYRNGVAIKTGSLSSNYQGGGNVYVGTTGWISDFFYGAIDDIRMWNHALTAIQVDSVFQAEKAVCAPFGLSSTIVDATCQGSTNGMVTVSTTGGVYPFTFAWTGGQTGNPATALAAANYTVVLTDAVGCKDSVSMFVNQPAQITSVLSATNATCYGGSNGMADAQTIGGTPPYFYSWAPINGSGSTLSNVNAGSYTCMVTDVNGCYGSDTITIGQGAQIAGGITVSSGTVCQGEPDTLTVSASGGAGSYWYEWHNFTGGSVDTTYTPSFVIEPVGTGSTVVGLYVYDMLGCSAYMSTFFWTNPADSMSGYVYEPNSNPVVNAKIYIVKQKSTHVGLGDTAASVTPDANGYYYAQNLFWGDYFIKVVPDSATYPLSIPTYYSNKQFAFQWDSALIVQHHTCIGVNDAGKNVTIIEMTPQSGPGTISGVIYTVPGYGNKVVPGYYSPQGAPLKGVDVKLGKNPGGSPAARTTTDTTGAYTFTNVALGSYKIYVDVPNYGMDSARVVNIDPVDSVSQKNDYFIDSNMVHVVPHYYIAVTSGICAGDSVFAAGAYQHNTGIYYDSLLTTMNGDSVIVTNLTVNNLPTVTATTSADTVCSGNMVTLTGGGAATYIWTGGVTDGVAFVPSLTDTYTVTGTDANSCQGTATVTVVVKTCVGINSYTNSNAINLFPNPSASKITITAGEVPSGIEIFDATGKSVLKLRAAGKETSADVSMLTGGMYFVKLQLSQRTQIIRFTKE